VLLCQVFGHLPVFRTGSNYFRSVTNFGRRFFQRSFGSASLDIKHGSIVHEFEVAIICCLLFITVIGVWIACRITLR
jgi:hypothetical protein